MDGEADEAGHVVLGVHSGADVEAAAVDEGEDWQLPSCVQRSFGCGCDGDVEAETFGIRHGEVVAVVFERVLEEVELAVGAGSDGEDLWSVERNGLVSIGVIVFEWVATLSS